MPRTLHVDTEPTWRGGEQQVLYLLLGLRTRGLEAVLLAHPGGPLIERALASGLDARPLCIRNEADVVAAWRLARTLRRETFDIVHAHTSHAHTIALVARALLPRRARPIVLVARRVDFSIYRHSFLGLNALKYRRADRIVAVSEAVKRVLVRDGLDGTRITVIRDGIDVRRIERAPERRAELRAALDVPLDAPLVGNVAALAPHKGQRYLVEAVPLLLKLVPAARVIIAGSGELREALEARARELKLGPALVFAGFRPPEEVISLVKAFDVFVFPSVGEGLGSSLLEAMAAGTPIVATRAGGIPEIVEDGVTGLLVPPADPEALGLAIARLLRDRSLALRLAAAARIAVREHGSADRMVRETVDLYRDLVARDAPAASWARRHP